MVRWRRTPAIFAGLAGGAVWGVPVLAGASTLDGVRDVVLVTLDDLLASPVAYFFVGLAAGAVVTGVVAGVSGHRSRKHLQHELDRVISERDLLRAEGVPTVIHISSPGVVLEPWSLDVQTETQPSKPSDEASGVSDEGGLDSTQDLERFAVSEQVTPISDTSSHSLADVRAVPEAEDLDEPDAEEGSSRSPVIDEILPDATPVPTPQPNAPAHEVLGRVRSSRMRARLDDLLPRLDEGVPAPVAPPVASHQDARGEDYERVAEEYVRTSRASERDKRRSRGVRNILGERLRGNVMDGLPVIERADGSTADIGTSWWTREVGSTHSFAPLDPSTTANIPPVTAAPDPMSTAALRAGELARAQHDAQAAGLSSATDNTADLGATTRSAVIAQRLSSVDMSLYPEEHDGEDRAGGDMFEQAMRALDARDSTVIPTAVPDERASVPAPLSEDLKTGAVVTPDTLADAGRDKAAEDYVDYLVRDEMERSRARRTQPSSHSILTIFDGTGDLSDAAPGRRGKHFASSRGTGGHGKAQGGA